MALKKFNPVTPSQRQLVLTRAAIDAIEARFSQAGAGKAREV